MASTVLAETRRGGDLGAPPGPCPTSAAALAASPPPGSSEEGGAARDAASLEGELHPQALHRSNLRAAREPPTWEPPPGTRAPSSPSTRRLAALRSHLGVLCAPPPHFHQRRMSEAGPTNPEKCAHLEGERRRAPALRLHPALRFAQHRPVLRPRGDAATCRPAWEQPFKSPRKEAPKTGPARVGRGSWTPGQGACWAPVAGREAVSLGQRAPYWGSHCRTCAGSRAVFAAHRALRGSATA